MFSTINEMMCVHITGASEPLLCKFADGGQKKRQSQAKYIPNGRSWTRDAEVRLVSPVCNCVLEADRRRGVCHDVKRTIYICNCA